VEHLLPDLLGVLNKIWTQSDWENKYMRYTYCISGLFGNDQFRRTVHSLVKSFENLLGGRIVEFSGICEAHSLVSADYLYSSTLPKLMLPLILRVYLQCFVPYTSCNDILQQNQSTRLRGCLVEVLKFNRYCSTFVTITISIQSWTN
jgi:hypothetical protein